VTPITDLYIGVAGENNLDNAALLLGDLCLLQAFFVLISSYYDQPDKVSIILLGWSYSFYFNWLDSSS